MILKTLKLTNFRSWSQASFHFEPNTNFVIGPNASGKTNILEAIFLIASTAPLAHHRFRDLFKQSTKHVKVETVFVDSQNYEHILSFNLVFDSDTNRFQRSFLISGNKVTRLKFLSQVSALFFEPNHLYFITGSPQRRRRTIDQFLKSFDWEYSQSLGSYKKIIRQRNKILSQIKAKQAAPQSLWPWNKSLVKKGQIIQAKRRQFIDFFNRQQQENNSPTKLIYQASWLDENLISQPANLQKEINAETTLWGPHRDDFIFAWQNQPLIYYGSRGQHRLAIFQLFISQKTYIEQITKQKPILLLDDVFSELDSGFQQKLLKHLHVNQTIVADIHPLDIPNLHIIDLKTHNAQT
ncbi:MAG: DNA replication and repair protein RecF [bacterium]|nr:DNA replication and repair protein RecF [bacterium]